VETRETIILDTRAQQRLLVLTHVLTGELERPMAADILCVSPRQLQRLLERFRREGAASLVHGNTGRVPGNRIDEAVRAQVVDLARATYAGFNTVHLTELLAEEHGIVLAAKTVRRMLVDAGVRPVRTRRRGAHRSRRERMPRAGMLLQVDGSRHDWLEGRGPMLTLIGAVDDATGVVTGAVFRDHEDAAGYFAVLTQTARRHGLPLALYSDRHGIFVKDPARPLTVAEQLVGQRSPTQVRRALDATGIGWIGATSPQAKGRVERGWGTHQDRLRSALRRAGASTLAEANAVLARYLPRHNARFGVPPADPAPAWRAWPIDEPIEAVYCFWYPRRVAADSTISWEGQPLALPKRPDGRTWAGTGVMIQERLDGSLWVSHGGIQLRLTAAPATPSTLRARHLDREPYGDLAVTALEAAPAPPPSPPPRPTERAPHPWRRYPAVRPAVPKSPAP
jgi:transposase